MPQFVYSAIKPPPNIFAMSDFLHFSTLSIIRSFENEWWCLNEFEMQIETIGTFWDYIIDTLGLHWVYIIGTFRTKRIINEEHTMISKTGIHLLGASLDHESLRPPQTKHASWIFNVQNGSSISCDEISCQTTSETISQQWLDALSSFFFLLVLTVPTASSSGGFWSSFIAEKCLVP